MNKISEAELLKNAIEIGESIIEKAIIDSKGIHWRTVKSITPYDDIETSISENIYTGVSGILLFYIELYKSTKSEIYLEYINSSAEWLINYCHNNPPLHGFYFGRIGTVYTLIKVSEINKKEYYRQKATEISLQFKNITDVPVNNFNLFNGLAGTIFGLLYLHSVIEEDWILDSIYDGIDHLIKHAKSQGTGFYWDFNYHDNISRSSKPLCSMPLGSSGIGLLFLNLSAYFSNTDYQYFAEQAFAYENQYLNTSLKSWPDFRIFSKGKNLNKMRQSYIHGYYDKFKSNSESLNWTYGITGIGFTRFKALDIFDCNKIRDEFNIVLDKIKTDNITNQLTNYTLATGKAGLGLLLLELFIAYDDKTYYEHACKIAKEAIDKNTKNKFHQFGFDCDQAYEDDSLFMGNAGIGYYYLSLLSWQKNFVLFPYISEVCKSSFQHKIYKFEKQQGINAIINTWYPNTMGIINNNQLLNTAGLKHNALETSLTIEIGRLIKLTNDRYLKDAYKYDRSKQKFQKKIAANYCLFTFCQEVELKKNRQLLASESTEALMSQTLLLNNYAKFTESGWNWAQNASVNVKDESETYTVLTPNGKEHILSKNQDEMLRSFKGPQKVSKVYKSFIKANSVSNQNTDYLKAVFINLIKAYLENGVLISINTPLFHRWNFSPFKKTKIEYMIPD